MCLQLHGYLSQNVVDGVQVENLGNCAGPWALVGRRGVVFLLLLVVGLLRVLFLLVSFLL